MRPVPRHRLGWKAIVRFWLEDHRELLGVPLALITIAALILVLDPHYPAKPVVGRITGLGAMNQRKSVVSGANVDVGGRSVVVAVPLRHGCAVGDQIRLRQLGVRWGYSYSVELTPRPCGPPPFRH